MYVLKHVIMIDSLIIYKEFSRRLPYLEFKKKLLKICKSKSIKHLSNTNKNIVDYEKNFKFISQTFGNERTTAKLYLSSFQKFTVLFDDYRQVCKFNININKFLFGNNFYNVISSDICNISDYSSKMLQDEFIIFIQKLNEKLQEKGINVNINNWYLERFDIGYNLNFENSKDKFEYLNGISKGSYSRNKQSSEIVDSNKITLFESKSLYKVSKRFTVKVYDKTTEYIKNTPKIERNNNLLALNVVRFEIELRKRYLIEKFYTLKYKSNYPHKWEKILRLRYLEKTNENHINEKKQLQEFRNDFNEYMRAYSSIKLKDLLINHYYFDFSVKQFHKYRKMFFLNRIDKELNKKEFNTIYPTLSYNNFKRYLKMCRKEGSVEIIKKYYQKSTYYKYKTALNSEIYKKLNYTPDIVNLKKILK